MGHGVKLSELAEKMELKNLTPTVELKGKGKYSGGEQTGITTIRFL